MLIYIEHSLFDGNTPTGDPTSTALEPLFTVIWTHGTVLLDVGALTTLMSTWRLETYK